MATKTRSYKLDKAYYDNDKLLNEYKLSRDVKLRNKIALNNINLIYPITRKFYIPGKTDLEELNQEAFIFLLKAVESYDPDLGFQFSTYATKCIYGINNYKLEYSENTSMDSYIKVSDNENIELIDTIEDDKIDIEKSAEYTCLNDRIKEILTNEEYKIIKLSYYYEYTNKRIQKKLKSSIETIRKLKYRAEKKIYNDPYFIDYRDYEKSQNSIGYLSAIDYTREKVQTSNISNPVWDAVLQREKREKQIRKGIFKTY